MLALPVLSTLPILSSFKSTFSFILTSFLLLSFLPKFTISSLSPSLLMASLQSSFSPIPHLTTNIKHKPTSLLSSSRNPFFLDFVGLYCKSKRVRRRIGVSSKQTIISPTNSSVVKAVLDLQRHRFHQSFPPQQIQQVFFLFFLFIYLIL